MTRHKLKLSGSPGNYRVQFDDHDVTTSLRGLSLTVDGESWPQVTLDVIVWDLEETELDAIAAVPDDTRDLLVRLGWTPPKDESEPTKGHEFRRFDERDHERAAEILNAAHAEFGGQSTDPEARLRELEEAFEREVDRQREMQERND